MVNKLEESIRYYGLGDKQTRRYLRVEEAKQLFHLAEEVLLSVALSVDALYQLPRTTLIHQKKMEDFMKHLYKVPNTSKYVQKKYVSIGEGSITYSIGHHRFIEMARAAGAVYKINEGTGGTVLINLDIFDEYMEQFREDAISMKHPLFAPAKGE
ncbi:MAG: DUF6462 family protein [Lachnospiraceae bacterium]